MPQALSPLAAFLILAAWALAGCATAAKPADPDLNIDRAADPDARYIEGLLVDVRPRTSTLLISKGNKVDALNFSYVKYDAATRLFLDNQPATLTDLDKYMPAKVKGRMRRGQFVAETAKFSSVRPLNAPAATAPAQP